MKAESGSEEGSDQGSHDRKNSPPTGGGEEAPATPSEDDKVKPGLFIALFITSLFALGLYEIAFNLEENRCSMTYMYEYPEFINIEMEESVKQKFPKYGLYAYGEGKMVQDLKEEKFRGIPVLFIPGNSGSFKQVRSMASVALRKAIEESEYKVHFDYFAVDYAEEYSAIYGGVLELQTQYLRHAVRKILSLYTKKSNKNPTSVVILAHSMGGIVAKSLFLDPSFNPYQVQVMITLATPHTPVLVLDRETRDFYEKVDTLWDASRNKSLKHITMVSIGGGERDLQVRSGLTVDRFGDLNTATTSASSVWVSADHRCIVWCKQLVLALNRALFDLIGPVSKQITTDKYLRKEVFNYHLLHRSGGKEFKGEEMHPSPQELDKDGYWSDILKRQFTFLKENSTCNHYAMIKVQADIHHKFLTLDAVRMDNDDWVFGCKETKVHKNTKMCELGENLSGQSEIIPSKGKRKSIHLDMHNLKSKFGYSHVVVHTPADTEDTKVNIDLYDPRERQVSTTVPKWITFWRSYPVIEKTIPGAVFYNISLGGIEHPWQAYRVHVDPLQCNHLHQNKVHYGLVRFYTPWANDTTQTLVGENINFTNSLTVKLMTSRPQDLDPSIQPQVHMYLDPACTYTVSIQASMPQMMSQMLRYYAPMLLPFMTCVLILVVAFQMRRMENEKYCRSSLLVLMANISPISVVLPSRMMAYVAVMPVISNILPVTDIQILQDRGLDFGILPIMLMFASIGTVFLLSLLLWAAVIAAGNMAHQATVAYFNRFTPHEVLAEYAISLIERFPVILATVLIAVGLGSCGSLALCLGSFCCFVKVFKMYQEYIEGLVKRTIGIKKEDDPSLLSGVNFQFSLLLLWLMNTVLNLPTLLSYIQNLQGGVSLPSDPSLIHAIILSSSLPVLWKNEGKPSEHKKFYSAVAVVLQFTAILVACFGTVSMYRVPFAISSVFVVVATHQLLAPPDKTEKEVLEEEKEPVPTPATSEAHHSISKVRLEVPPSAAGGTESQESSESEYEYKYELNIRRKKLSKEKFNLLKSPSQNTDTGFGEEGLDWEIEEETENDVTVYIYPYTTKVYRRLTKLPSNFTNDIINTLLEGILGLVCVASVLWTAQDNQQIRIEVVPPDTLDEEYLPDNHPLRRLGQRKKEYTVENVSVITGLLLNIKSVLRAVVYFHWKFYHDIFSTLRRSIVFSVYLVYPAPRDLYYFLRDPYRETQSFESRPNQSQEAQREIVSGGFMNLFLRGLSSASLYITYIVKTVSGWIEERRQYQASVRLSNIQEPVAQASSTPPSAPKLNKDAKYKVDHSLPRNPEVRGDEEVLGCEEVPKFPLKRRNTIKHIRYAVEETLGVKASQERPIETLKKDVEKLRISTHEDGVRPKLDPEPIFVSGPWIQQPLVPGYHEKDQSLRPEDISGVYEREKDPPKPQRKFEAEIPSSSVFERDPNTEDFEVRAKKSPSRSSLIFNDDYNQMSEDSGGKTALSANIHMSMCNIHAACENEKENSEELQRLSSSERLDEFRYSDLELPTAVVQTTSASRPLALAVTSTADFPKFPHISLDEGHGGRLDPSTRRLDPSTQRLDPSTQRLDPSTQNEIPEIKRRYSVKDEIAQLRQSVREELIHFRSTEPDEAISTGGSDEEYERIIIMKYEKELEDKFAKPKEREGRPPTVPRRKQYRGRSFKSAGSRSPPPQEEKYRQQDEAELSSSEERDWEIIDREDIDLERYQRSSSFGPTHPAKPGGTPVVGRRRQSGSEDRGRSSSLGRHWNSGLNRDVSPATSIKNSQRRRDSFLDLTLPFDSPRTAESLESLIFFSKTISDTADRFQRTLSETAERFSKTLDETAATLKKAISEKNIAHATTQELTESLHDTAQLLTLTSQVLAETARASVDQFSGPDGLARIREVATFNLSPADKGVATQDVPHPPKRKSKTVCEDETAQPISQGVGRLDTIVSQSEVEPSDTELEIPFQPLLNQTVERLREKGSTSFSPLDPRMLTGSPDTRPSSAGSEASFKTPFGKTATSRSARDIFDQMRPASSQGPLRRREESRSPDRARNQGRGRDERMGGNQPLTRTQSAAPVQRNTVPEAGQLKESRIRSASVAPSQSTVYKPNYGSSSSLHRAPSYRLLGGKLVESFYSRDTHCSDNNMSSTGAPTSFTILKQPYLITTKDGRKQTLAEYEKNLIADYKRRSQQNLVQ